MTKTTYILRVPLLVAAALVLSLVYNFSCGGLTPVTQTPAEQPVEYTIDDDFSNLLSIRDAWQSLHTWIETTDPPGQLTRLEDAESHALFSIVDGQLEISNVNGELAPLQGAAIGKTISGSGNFTVTLAVTEVGGMDAVNPPDYGDSISLMILKEPLPIGAESFFVGFAYLDADMPTECYPFYSNLDWENTPYPGQTCSLPLTLKISKSDVDENNVNLTGSWIDGDGIEHPLDLGYTGDMLKATTLTVAISTGSAAGGDPFSVKLDGFTCDGCSASQ